MAHSAIVGSWFPSGYYGHTRSKCREDFMGEYRNLAKPSPPKQFLARSQDNSTHAFSKHDNRNLFSNTAAYFEVAHGRKKVTSPEKKHSHLLTWVPQKRELYRSGPKLSVYTQDYHSRCPEPIPQILVKKPMTTFDDRLPITTTYLCTYGKVNPNIRQLEKIAAAASNPPRVRPVTSKPSLVDCSYRESVAGCMSWQPTRPTCTRVSTQTDKSCVKQEIAAQSNESKKDRDEAKPKEPLRSQTVPCEIPCSPSNSLQKKSSLLVMQCMDRQGRAAYSAPPNRMRSSSGSLSMASESSGHTAPCENGPVRKENSRQPYCNVEKSHIPIGSPRNYNDKFKLRANDPCGDTNDQAAPYKCGVGDNVCRDSNYGGIKPSSPCNNSRLSQDPCNGNEYSKPKACSTETLNKCNIEAPTMLNSNASDRCIDKTTSNHSDISNGTGHCAAINPSAFCPNNTFPATNWGQTNKCVATD